MPRSLRARARSSRQKRSCCVQLNWSTLRWGRTEHSMPAPQMNFWIGSAPDPAGGAAGGGGGRERAREARAPVSLLGRRRGRRVGGGGGGGGGDAGTHLLRCVRGTGH